MLWYRREQAIIYVHYVSNLIITYNLLQGFSYFPVSWGERSHSKLGRAVMMKRGHSQTLRMGA